MTRPETIKRKNSLSRYKLATEMEKLHETDTYEHCSIWLFNTTRPRVAGENTRHQNRSEQQRWRSNKQGNLTAVFLSLVQFGKAGDCKEKELVLKIEIGDRSGEASCYGYIGSFFPRLVQYDKAREYQEKEPAIKIEIGDRSKEATSYGNLGTFLSLAWTIWQGPCLLGESTRHQHRNWRQR